MSELIKTDTALSNLAQTSEHPVGLEIVSAKGSRLIASDGKEYIDMIAGIGVSALGHGNKKIAQAVKNQVDKHMHVMVFGEFIQQAQQRAARRLTSMLPEKFDSVYFVNSGAEAVEAALKLAKRIRRRFKIIAFEKSYHGNTHGAMSVSGNEDRKSPFRPLLPDVHFHEYNAFEDLEFMDDRIACVIIETIQGDAGVRLPDVEFLKALRAKCDEIGALLIFDEIQCGMGRSGALCAFEKYGVEPDMICLGKALGGGMPVGALVCNRSLMENFAFDPPLGHITTFGGHPVICAAVDAFLEELESTIDYSEVDKKGQRIKAALEACNGVLAVRQEGLFIGVDLKSSFVTDKVVQRCIDNGVIIYWFLSCPSSFRISPPLNISDSDLEEAMKVICEAIEYIDEVGVNV
jgi:acetylornithine/N-succinyldiaminopimelate aminotransferase